MSLPSAPSSLTLLGCLLAAVTLAACGGGGAGDDDAGRDQTADSRSDGPELSDDTAEDPPPEVDASAPDGELDTLADTAADGADASLADLPEGRGAGVFVEGCPIPDRSIARTMRHPEARITGPGALGGPGDTLLMNERAAFVIQDPANVRTYWYYGGGLIDAVAVDGCAQAGPERYDELAFLVGDADLSNFEQSTLRGFRGDRVEIIDDGSGGGAARVRVHGADDRFWLIELELLSSAFEAGEPKPLSEPYPIEMWVDYILEPGSSVLRMELGARNLSDESLALILGSANWFADGTSRLYYNEGQLAAAGLSLDTGVPWLVATSGEGAWALSIENRNAGTINIAGVDGFLDLDQFLVTPRLGPAGSASDARVEVFFMAVGASDAHSAIAHLPDVNPRPFRGPAVSLEPLTGEVVDAVDGAPVAGATLTLYRRNSVGQWSALDQLVARSDGRYEANVPTFPDGTYRLVATYPGRPSPVALEGPFDAIMGARFETGRAARLVLDVRDDDDRYLPAKAVLYRGGRRVRTIFTRGELLETDVEPGEYELSITRGIEYQPFDQPLALAADETTTVRAVLPHVIDTSGYLSMDGHIHGGPSPDSGVEVPDRLVSLAAEGVEVAVSTDHEAVIAWEPYLPEVGLGDWIHPVLGEEVTPPLPEHHNAYPLRQRPGRRGVPVELWGFDIAELHASIRARGADVVALNHPRNGCNYLCLIGYDRLTGDATLDDPTLLGYAPDAALWSWNFDTVEYQNGPQSPFVDPDQPDRTGLFEDWTSFINHGHRVTATGVTDVHGEDAQGIPRNFFESPVDSPAEATDDMLVDAILAGRSLVSTGAFARVSVNGEAGMGDTITDTDGSVDLALRIEALPAIDVTHYMVFVNCDEAVTGDTSAPTGRVKLDRTITVPVEGDAYLVVMGFGEQPLPRNLPQFDPSTVPRFTTNPIYIDGDGDGVWTPPGGRTCRYELRGRDGARIIPRALEAPRPLLDFDCAH
jgi:hypothetical protein